MPMTANGLAKLIEECGELVQVAGKKLAYYTTDDHPDGAGSLKWRLEVEMGDVIGAIRFVTEMLDLSMERIEAQANNKHARFRSWHARPDNNEHGVDRRSNDGRGT